MLPPVEGQGGGCKQDLPLSELVSSSILIWKPSTHKKDAEEVLDSCQSLDQDDDALQAVQESHDPEMVEVADDVVEVGDDVVEVADDFADDLHEWRALRARQDEEYLESLQTDQERGQAQHREVEVYRKRKEALERRWLNLSNRAEPQDGIPLQVKYPDGHVARRRFDLMQPIQMTWQQRCSLFREPGHHQ
ncbi:hypothetical protein PFLUV_G00012790 [Perca fluviatilis]|uniref:UBX domain-containing protein n=1 Tax=Perca fluviatilis TaxID=8168 RepID=A0A6A5FSG8_PERFL|nr:hypothetical protein PFLUV_G00012790 [Perca fluviatilis]